MIVAEYANTFLTLTFNKYETGESVYSYHRIRRPPADGTAVLMYTITPNSVRQVGLFTSGLSNTVMLELFKETPKDVTYTFKLMELENVH